MKIHRVPGRLAIVIGLAIVPALFLSAPAAAAGVPFSPTLIIDAGLLGAVAAMPADVDGDGDMDFIGAGDAADSIAWYENTAGDGSAWASHVVATSSTMLDAVNYVAAADVDGDGDVDILSAAPSCNTVAWYENTAGDGSSWTGHVIDAALAGAVWVAAADLDGDGDLDAVSSEGGASSIAWYENMTRDGSAWTKHLIDTTFAGPDVGDVADVDGDGDLDVVGSAIGLNTIAWFENTAGDGSAWTRYTIDAAALVACAAISADVDGDGDLDVLGSAFGAGAIAWYENTSGDGSTWARQVIDAAIPGVENMASADMDGDGDTDVLAAASGAAGIIAWWENTAGDGSAWTRHELDTSFAGAWQVAATDVDGDGDLDVAGPARTLSSIAWWQNETIHRSAAYPAAGRHTVTTATSGTAPASAADLDGDGDLDVLGASFNGGNIEWWENSAPQGNGSAWTTHSVGSSTNPTSVDAGDMDGDGDLDVLSLGSCYLEWWENTAGDGSAWAWHSVSMAYCGGYQVHAADVDGDGDMDALGAYRTDNTIAWFENTAGDGTAWAPHAVDNTFAGASCLDAADVDGDGDMDVLGGAWDSGAYSWWENTAGDGSAWTRWTVGSQFGNPTAVYAADVNGDGDPDVIGASVNGGTITWWENAAGDGSAWTADSLPSSWPIDIYAGDVDGDGDVDLLGAGYNTIGWWENTAGDGSAWTERYVADALGDNQGAYAADVDGDGDLDVLGAAWAEIAWWENRGGQFGLGTTDTAPAQIVSGAEDDALKVTMTHLGRAGDTDEEWAKLELLFEASPGVPLSSAQANALIDRLEVYHDDGSGAFEPGSDTLVTSVGTLALASGRQTVILADADPLVQVSQGAPGIYFIAVTLTPDAYKQSPAQFRVTHLVDPANGPISTAEDRDHDINLSMEYGTNVASGVVAAGAQAELSLTKAASDAAAAPGQVITYTLAYSNNGPSTASSVVITDLVPAILLEEAFTASDPALTLRPAAPFAWDLASLPPGEVGSITITGVVDPALAAPVNFGNTAEIRAVSFDPIPANNTSTVTVTVPEIPVHELTATNDGPTTLGQATGLAATVTSGTNIVYEWAFGDGAYGTGQSTPHTYQAAGLYTAVVTASNPLGAMTATTTVEITNLAPIAYQPGSPLPAAVGGPVTLDGSGSIDPDGHYPLSYGWMQTYGPAVVLSDPHAMRPTFTAPATPTGLGFALAVTDAYGLADPTPAQWDVMVEDHPIDGLVVVSDSPTEFGQPTTLTATVTSGTNVQYTWAFGDGQSDSGATISHIYPAAGSYTATVQAVNGLSMATASTPVVVTAAPTCLALLDGVTIDGLPTAYTGLTWIFSATVAPPDATPPITYTWSPEPASGQGTGAARYTWATTGTKTLTVLAQNCGGLAGTEFVVDVLPFISETVDPGVTTTLVFTDPQEVTTTVVIPPAAVSETITLVLTPVASPTHPIPDGMGFANHAFNLDAYLGPELLPGFVFSQPVSISVHYTDADVAGLDESQLSLYYWAEDHWASAPDTCSPPSAYSRDLANNRLAVAICHLSEYIIPGPESISSYRVYLPAVVEKWLEAPDLVVEQLAAGSDNVQVVVRNQGTAPVMDVFWVDAYVDPSPAPTRVNQTWNQLSDQGLAWAVAGDGLPLWPGQAITLTVGDAHYRPEYSYVKWPLRPRTRLYAQADSADADTSYGAVWEMDEIRGEPYNNIGGPVMVGVGRLEEWKVGRMEGWEDGMVEGRVPERGGEAPGRR